MKEHGWDLSRALNSFFTAKIDQAEADMSAKTNAKADLPKKTVAEGTRLNMVSETSINYCNCFSSPRGLAVHQSP